MMMYDNGLEMEAELDDLGEEFAAQCAATVGPSYGHGQPQMSVDFEQPQPQQQQFEPNNAHLQMEMNMSRADDSLMDQQDQMPYHLDESLLDLQSQGLSAHVYQQETVETTPMEEPQYGQIEYDHDPLPKLDQHPMHHTRQLAHCNYDDQEQRIQPQSQIQMQQHQYGQVMYHQNESLDQQLQPHQQIRHEQTPSSSQFPAQASEQQVHQQYQPQHHNLGQQAHIQRRQPNYVVVPSRQQPVIMPVHRSQQMYAHQQDSQPMYVQHLPDGRTQQIVYVKRVANQPVQTQPQRVFVQGPNGLIARTTRPVPQPVRLVRTVSHDANGALVQRHFIQRPAVRQMQQAELPQQRTALPPPQVIRATPEHITRMVDHGDYVLPSHQRMAVTSSTTTNYANGEAYTRLHHRPVQRPTQQLHQQSQEEDQYEQYYPDAHPIVQDQQNQDNGRSNINPTSSRVPSTSQSTASSSSDASASGSQTKFGPAAYSIKPPALPIPKKKKPEPVAPTATEVAQAAAAQRISTEEGWKQMNTWIKSAEKENKTSHLVDLLKQCLQAKVSVDLLMSNDTPKFVRKLSKNHEDNEVKKLAASCVIKWKKEVANPEVPPPVKKEKKPKQDDIMDYEDADDLPLKPLAVASTSKDSKKDHKEKRRSTDTEGEKKEEKKNKAKARVYTAKSRLTGLEDIDDAKPPEAKKRKESPPKEQPSKKVSSSPQVKTPTKKLAVKKAPTVQLSTGFMNALAVSVEPKKKAAPKKRSIEAAKPAVSDTSNTPTVLDGLFADQTKAADESKNSPTPPPAVVEAEEPEMLPASRRRIRFADEIGKELVLIKEFEIEEGERINVNHLSPDEMKHHEMMMERQFKEQSGGSTVDEDDEQQASSSDVSKRPEVKWRLIPLSDLKCTIDHGSQCEAKLIELERQKTAMRAFCDPNFPIEILGEPDDFDPISARNHKPTMIPLDLVPEDDSQSDRQPSPAPLAAPAPAPEEPKALPSNLQSLLDGLKKKGIVGGSPSVSAPAPSSGLSALASSLSGISSAGLNALTNGLPSATPQMMGPRPPPMATYGQIPTYQQHPAGGLVMPPPIHHRPGMPPPLGVPSSSASHLAQRHPSDSSPAMPATPVQRMAAANAGGNPVGSAPGVSHQSYGGGHQQYNNMRQCQFFKSQRGCHYGSRCKFAHGDQPPGVAFGGGDRGGYYNRGGGYGGGRGGYGQPRGGGRPGFGGGDGYHHQQRGPIPDPVRIDVNAHAQNGFARAIPQSPDQSGIQSPPNILSPVGDGTGDGGRARFREAVTIPIEAAASDSPASPTS